MPVMQQVLDQIEQARSELDASVRRMESNNGRARAIETRCDTENRDATAAEAKELDRLNTAFFAAETEANIIRARIDELQSTPQPRLTEPTPIRNSAYHSMPRSRPALIGQRTAKFADVFAGRQLNDDYGGRFESFGEFALAVANGGLDSRLIRDAAMTTQEGATGGFLVPLQYFSSVLDASLEREIVRPAANVIPMASKQGVAPVFDYADQTGAKRAGLQLLWGQEATALPEQRGKVREVELSAHKANIYVRVSSELVADVPMFDRHLGEAMVSAVAAGLDAVFIMTGTGAGQPLSIVNAANTIVVTKESGQATPVFLLLDNLAKMAARLAPASYSRSIWLIHPTVVVPLFMMATVVKNVAGTENVGGSTAAAVTVDGNGQLRIFGRPASVTDACAPLGTKGDVVLADLSKYLVGLRADATIRRDESVHFDSDEICFRLIIRLDGMPADKEATKLRDGTNTVAPFVTLETR